MQIYKTIMIFAIFFGRNNHFFVSVISIVTIFAQEMKHIGNFISVRAALVVLWSVSVVIALSGCRNDARFQSMEGMIWNTGYHITYKGDEALADSVLATLHSVEESVSVFSPSSVVSQVNSNATDKVDSIFSEIYQASCKIFDESDGYFDPTLAPLIEAYGFAGRKGNIPGKDATDSIMQFVGLKRTHLSGGRLHKEDPRLQFNFSAIAKGYGCDAVGMMFHRNGCGDFLVEIGGEIVASGCNPEGGKWHIQVDKPVFSKDSVVHDAQVIIAISDCGVATSGNYRNYRESGSGARLGHTFDPHTGFPAVNDMLSATVVAPTCMEADAYATACMAMTFSRAQEMVRRCGLKVLLINCNGDVWMSDGFEKLISK